MQNINLTDAAVLVPVYRDTNGEIRVILIRRSEHGVHGGQLAFPGGKTEPYDKSLFETALRESEEEIGINRNDVKLLSELTAIETVSTRFRIYPFLAKILPLKTWIIQEEEIAEVIEVNINDLANEELHLTGIFLFEDWKEPKEISYFKIGSYQLWGATYRILKPLISRLIAGEFEI
jgi:8-oxo-dGTP pyrophosphatase MutT (NUDIX family)